MLTRILLLQTASFKGIKKITVDIVRGKSYANGLQTQMNKNNYPISSGNYNNNIEYECLCFCDSKTPRKVTKIIVELLAVMTVVNGDNEEGHMHYSYPRY